MKKIIASILIFIIIIIGFGIFQVEKTTDYNQVLEIKKGEPLKKSLAKLKNSNELAFRLYLRFRNGGRDIKAGYYELKGKYNIRQIISILENGKSKMYKFTIIEGSTVDNIFDKLVINKKGNKEKFKQALKEIDFPYITPNGNFEGYFYPETYYIPEKSSEKYIIEIFLKEFLKKFPTEKYKDKEEFYKKLIMASLIQREAMLEEEKPLMASVLYNRIEKGMPLAIDSTINFIFNYEKKRIFYKDLEVDSPYNTYKNLGLPPTPICSPTKKSVEAVYNPAKTKYLFFVVESKGKHHFSETYKEHLRVQKK